MYGICLVYSWLDQEFSQEVMCWLYTQGLWVFLGKRLLLWVCGCRHSIYNYVVMTTRKLVHDEVKIFWCYGVSCPVVHAPFTPRGAWMTGHETICCMNYHVHSTWVCYQASNLIMHALPPCQAAKQGAHVSQSFFMRIYLILAV